MSDKTKPREPWFLSNSTGDPEWGDVWCITDGVDSFPMGRANATEFGLALNATIRRHDAELTEKVRTDLESLITDLDLARGNGFVFTYGAVQERLRRTLATLSTTPERSNT